MEKLMGMLAEVLQIGFQNGNFCLRSVGRGKYGSGVVPGINLQYLYDDILFHG